MTVRPCHTSVDWDSVDWSILERLRRAFLNSDASAPAYWQSRDDLEHYDFTFGRRIGWKWSAVVDQLEAIRWQPAARTLIDWGCGTARASRTCLAALGSTPFDQVLVWDRSPTATSFAREQLAQEQPGLDIQVADPLETCGSRDFVLLVSHVINELEARDLQSLIKLARQAATVIWVEPGTHVESRSLIAAREALRPDLRCWLPCTHENACGMLDLENQRHWCHHFARTPTEAFTESGWAQFGRRLGIDLRSLPYSYLVMDRREPAHNPNAVRVIGRPRVSTGVMKILRCRHDGVAEAELQKRTSKTLWKVLGKERHSGVLRWIEDEQARIHPLPDSPGDTVVES